MGIKVNLILEEEDGSSGFPPEVLDVIHVQSRLVL